jgi:hypothetical protein
VADYRRLDARDPVSGYAALSFDNRRLTPGLEGNLLGDPADQPVSIYVPDAYEREPKRRFPVIFCLTAMLLFFFMAMQILAQAQA